MNDIKTGFITDEKDERDLIFGAKESLESRFAGRTVLNESGDWTAYLPETEHQAPDYETNGCVSFGSLNAIEILRKFQDDLDENLSDRYVARMSNTDPHRGNTPRRVADTIKKLWSPKESEWPRPATLEEFYSNIPENIRSLAIGRGAYYEYGYERVDYKDLPVAMTFGPTCISVPGWFLRDNIYYRPQGQRDTHWAVCFAIQPNGNLMVFDSYYPFIKEVSKDVVPEVIYSYYLKKQVVSETLWRKFLKLLEGWFGT